MELLEKEAQKESSQVCIMCEIGFAYVNYCCCNVCQGNPVKCAKRYVHNVSPPVDVRPILFHRKESTSQRAQEILHPVTWHKTTRTRSSHGTWHVMTSPSAQMPSQNNNLTFNTSWDHKYNSVVGIQSSSKVASKHVNYASNGQCFFLAG